MSKEVASVTGKVVDSKPSILVSELYKRGAPVPIVIQHALRVDGERVNVSIVAERELVTSTVEFVARDARTVARAYTARVVWDECHFGSCRASVLCSVCSTPRRRLFVSTGVLAGSLICRVCAGVRYASQDMTAAGRLRSRMKRIRERLGVEPNDGGTFSLPGRPKGMHRSTFASLSQQYVELAAQLTAILEADRQTMNERTLERLSRRVDGWLLRGIKTPTL